MTLPTRSNSVYMQASWFNDIKTQIEGSSSNVVYADSSAAVRGDGSQFSPFTSLQDAIDLAELQSSTARKTIIVAAGSAFDEDITVTGGITSIIGMGGWTLGDAAGTNYASTTPRDFTWIPGSQLSNSARPSLFVGTFLNGEATTTHSAYVIAATISGDFIIESAPSSPATSVELHFNQVKITGAWDATTSFSEVVQCYFWGSLFDTTFLGAASAYLHVVESCQFDTTVLAVQYNRISDCELRDGMTVTIVPSGTLPPEGIYHSDLSGVFTSPANGIVLDAVSYYYFVANSASLGGSASIKLIENVGPTIDVDNLKAGVLDTDLTSVSASDDTLASAKAIKSAISAIAGGTGGINYIANNPDATSGIGGWTMSDDTNFVLTQNTTTPLRGDADFKIVKAASDQEGDYIAFDFDLQKADLAKKLLIKIDVDTSDSNYIDGDIAIKLYDLDNSAYIEASTVELLGGMGTFYSSPQTDASSTNYDLRFIVNNSNTNGYTIYFDNVNVGPQTISYGIPATNGKSFTPTGTWTTNTTYYGTYSRYADKADIDITVVTSGTPTTASLVIDISDLGSIDTDKLPTSFSRLGEANVHETGAQLIPGLVQYVTATTLSVWYLIDSSASSANPITASAVTQAAPFAFGNTDRISIKLRGVPIVGWSSNAAMSSDFGNRDIVADYYGSTTTVTSTPADVVFINKETDNTAMTSDNTNFIIPETSYYDVSFGLFTTSFAMTALGAFTGQLKVGSDIICEGVDVQQVTSTRNFWASGSKTGVYLEKENIVKLMQSVSNGSGALSDVRNNFLSIKKSASPQTTFESETVAARYTNTAGSTFNTSGTIYDVPFATKINDTHNFFAGATATLPKSGWYDVKSNLGFLDPSANTVLTSMTIYITPSVTSGISKRVYNTEKDFSIHSVDISGSMYFTKGETVKIQASTTFTGTGTVPSLYTGAGWNTFSIVKVS